VPVSGASAGGEVEAAVDEVAAVATVPDGGVPPQAGTGAGLADGHAEGVRGKNRETICCIVCCFVVAVFFCFFSLGYLSSLSMLNSSRFCLSINHLFCLCG
jgi:hypothetical protein